MAQKRVNVPLVPVVLACIYGIVLPLQLTVTEQYMSSDGYTLSGLTCC